MKSKIFNNSFIILIFFFILSCNSEISFLEKSQGKTFFYEVIFRDKENKRNVYRQSLSFLSISDNLLPVLKNDGEVFFFSQNDSGIIKKTLNNSISKIVLAFPVEVGTKWKTNDKTTLQMKLGYDRVYNTNLPLELENIIEKTNDTVSINGKKIKNCIKISSRGMTSFNPGPPLSNIKIEVSIETWYSRDFGIVKYIREETSDSETMGKISYDKTMIIDN